MRVNGETIERTETTSLLRLLQDLGFEPKAVAVELNGRIVPKAAFSATTLGADDTVEILRFVGGG